jgi:hypothetical protein
MQIHIFDPVTNLYVCSRSADPDPLRPGHFLWPFNSAQIAPPDIADGQRVVWDGSSWSVEDIPTSLDPSHVPEPTEMEILANLTWAVQNHLDKKALERRYDGILSLCTYATSTDLKFAAEGQAGVIWRDGVWSKCYSIMADVQAGKRTIPTEEELLAELPTFTWPDETSQ